MKRTLVSGLLSILAAVAFFGGAAHAASTTIVISQVYSGGGGSAGTYINDYVELKNISSTPQSLSGLSLVYGSASGQFASVGTNALALTGTVTLNPGQYYLVQLSQAGSGGTALPVPPDQSSTNLSMAAASGKVALVTSAFVNNTCGATATPCTLPNAAIIDLVSWGVSNNAEGGATVNNNAALTATQGSIRKLGGCADTDNNNADFDVVTTPIPRNSSTTTACGAAAPQQHVVDFNGDGKTDYAVVRNTGVGVGGQATWFINPNGTNNFYGVQWGVSTDRFVPEDYDGDGKTDFAVWRAGAPTVAAFYILQSQSNTLRTELFGQTGDDSTVVGDYDGDGKADVAVYRAGAAAGQQSTWFYRGTLNNPAGNVTFVPWGANGDFPAPGDYDGDGRNDFVVQRGNGNGQAAFWMNQTTAGVSIVTFGTPTDAIVPGDFDGDGKSDLAVARGAAGAINWYVRPSSTGAVSAVPYAVFGASATDFLTPGDYDGDGKTDVAVFRSGIFWVLGSTSGTTNVLFGSAGDYPVANFNVH